MDDIRDKMRFHEMVDINFIDDIQFHTNKRRFLPQGSFCIKTRWSVLWGSYYSSNKGLFARTLIYTGCFYTAKIDILTFLVKVLLLKSRYIFLTRKIT